jgi:multidrug efflux system outer membrane protein
MRREMRHLSLLTLAALLGGCVVGPDYQPPAVSVPAAYSDGASVAAAGSAPWWTGYGDPVLNDLMARALAQNLDVAQAAARVSQSREQENITRGQGGPTVNATAQASRMRLSENSISGSLSGLGASGGSSGSGGSTSALGLPGDSFSTFQAGFDASWELDLFGGQKRAIEAGRAGTQGAEWSQRDAQVMLAAEVSRSYLQYRADQRRIDLLDESIAAQRDLLQVVRARTGAGLVNDLDERRQQRDLQQLLAQREDLAAQATAQRHGLALLLGQEPNGLASQLTDGAAPASDVEVPAGLPSDLLKRRPDVRAAERQLAAATADIGAAQADLYPKISLTGAAQLVSQSLSTLLESDSLQGNVGGGLSLPIFDRGVRKATVRLREAQAQDAVIAYRKTVLTALRDVEDALSRLAADRVRVERLTESSALARDADETAQVRYRNGLTTFIDVIEARSTAISARDALVQAQAAVLLDIAALHKALGGGWDDTPQGQLGKQVHPGESARAQSR